MQTLNDGWKIDDLTVRKAVLKDVKQLQAICECWEDKRLLEGTAFDDDYVEKAILDPLLPPIEHAKRENYALMVIQFKQTIVGLFDCYHGYPEDGVLWIGMFVMDTKYQHQQISQRVVREIIAFGKRNGWKRCALAVYLKNWKGLRFWIQNGFKTIDRFVKDPQYALDAHAMLVLSQKL